MERQLAELEAPCGSGAGGGGGAVGVSAAAAAAAAQREDGAAAAAAAVGGGEGLGVLQLAAQQRQQPSTPATAQRRQQQQAAATAQRPPASGRRPALGVAATSTPGRATRRAAGGQQQQQQQQQQQNQQTPKEQQQPGASGRGDGVAAAAAGGNASKPPAATGAAAGASPHVGYGLGANASVLACRADWLLHRGRHEECYALTARALERDPYAAECLPAHLAAALALGRKNELFLRAHRLVEEHPDRALSWFAVGCYYMAARHFEAARRHFSKATALDRNSAPAWVGFGHAFAAQDESDQALAAYRAAARLFPGLHTPVLGMGMEYARMNNLGLAERLFRAAHELCPEDARVCHEIGALEYRNGRYASAERWLTAALACGGGGGVGSGDGGVGGIGVGVGSGFGSAGAEATLLALGHARRKQGDYTGALEAYRAALALEPNAASTHAAIAFALQLSGDAAGAVREYHVALGLRPDDAFSQEMLGEALREECARGAAALEAGGGDGGEDEDELLMLEPGGDVAMMGGA